MDAKWSEKKQAPNWGCKLRHSHWEIELSQCKNEISQCKILLLHW